MFAQSLPACDRRADRVDGEGVLSACESSEERPSQEGGGRLDGGQPDTRGGGGGKPLGRTGQAAEHRQVYGLLHAACRVLSAGE